MTKRAWIENAIRILAVIDAILLIGFLVLHITDTRLIDRGSQNDTHTIIPIVTDARAPEDHALQPGEAEQILGAADTAGRSAQAVLTVGDAQVNADLISGSFRQRGGPDFSLYIDTTKFRLLENEGRCYVAASGNAGVKLYLELAFLPGADTASLASGILNSYGAVQSNAPEKTEAFGGFSAIRVTGSSAETDLEAYVVSVNGGCLTAVSCVPGTYAADADSLKASFDSLILK